MRLLCLVPYPTEGPSNRYRVEQFLPYLSARGIEADLRPFMSPEFFRHAYQKGHWAKKGRLFLDSTLHRLSDLGKVGRYDGFLVHLEAFPLGPPVLEWLLSKSGKPILFDFEDAIYMPDPHSHPLFRMLKYRKKFYKILTLSRHVFVCNPYLKTLVERYNRRVTVLPTSIDIEKFTVKSKGGTASPVIGWIGSHSTLPYLLPLKEVFQELSRRHPFVLRIIGGGSELSFPGVEVENRPWRLETEVEDFQNLDIGLYPLPDSEWARAKTPFKSIQYMAAGLPVVVSPVGGNRTIVEEGKQGFFATSKEEWVEKLSRLLASRDLREHMGREGRKRVEERYALQENQVLFCDVVEELLSGQKRRRSKKRLFHLITDLDVGGTPILLRHTLAHADRKRYDLVVCSLKRRGDFSVAEEIEKLGVPVFFLNAERLLVFQALYRLYLLLKDEEVDILHTWLFHANLFGRFTGVWSRVPVIVSSELAIDPEKGLFRVLLDRWTAGLSKRIVVNAEAVRREVLQRERVPDKKITLIRTGVDTRLFSANGTEEAREEKVLLVVARLHAAKGHLTLLKALPKIVECFPTVKVFFAGDGPLRHSLEDWTRRRGLEGHVAFLGIRRDIPSLLQRSTLCILPSHEEGMPAAILEAMACGKAVVASRVGGIPEVIEDKKTGLLVPPGDPDRLSEAVIFLLSHPAERAAFGLRGRQKAETFFEVRDRVRELENLYEAVWEEEGLRGLSGC